MWVTVGRCLIKNALLLREFKIFKFVALGTSSFDCCVQIYGLKVLYVKEFEQFRVSK